jgi:hypothetical protein
MEITIKELIVDEKEDALLSKREIRESILRIPYYNIMLYKILSKGDIEEDQTEIQIVTPFGYYYCNYNKKVHDYLKKCIDNEEKEYLTEENK